MPTSRQILCTQELWVGGTAFACSVCDWSCCHVLILAGRCVAILGSSPMLMHKNLMWDWLRENWDDAEMLHHAETLNDAMKQRCNDMTHCFMLFLPFLYFDLVCLLILRAKKWLSIWIVFGISLFHLPFHSSNPLVGTDAATDLHIPSVLGLLFGCRVWSCHNHRVTCQTHNGENQKIEDVKWQMILYTWYAVRET